MKLVYIFFLLITATASYSQDLGYLYNHFNNKSIPENVKSVTINRNYSDRTESFYYEYNIEGKPVRYWDSSENYTTVTYDKEGRILTVESSTGKNKKFTEVEYIGALLKLNTYRLLPASKRLENARVYNDSILMKSVYYNKDEGINRLYSREIKENKTIISFKKYNSYEEIILDENSKILERTFNNGTRVEYVYNKDESIHSVILYPAKNYNKEAADIIYEYIYNGSQLTKIVEKEIESQEVLSEIIYRYIDGKKSKQIYNYYSNGELVYTLTSTFNKENKITNERFDNKSSPFSFNIKKKYLRDNVIFNSLINNNEYTVEENTYAYTEDDKFLGSINYSEIEQVTYEKKYKYNSNGDIVSSRDLDRNSNILYGVDYLYNEKFHLISRINYGESGYITYSTDYEYKYDKSGNIIEKREYSSNNKDEVFDKLVYTETNSYTFWK